MTSQQRERYELESIMRASLKPIEKHSKPKKQAKQHEGASA